MTRWRTRSLGRVAASLTGALVLAPACASITSETTIDVRARPGERRPLASIPPRDRDLEGRRIITRALETSWEQRGALLTVTLREDRRCQRVEEVPVIREERTSRRAGGALYVEYALATAAYAMAAFAFAQPTAFSNTVTADDDGRAVLDPTPGYIVGGVFTAIGTGALSGAIYDTVRARDERTTIETYRVEEGPIEACNPATAPASDQLVTLVINEHHEDARADEHGVARFLLPETLEPPAREDDARSDSARDDVDGDDDRDDMNPGTPAPDTDSERERTSLAAVIELAAGDEPPSRLPITIVLPYKRTIAEPNAGRHRAADPLAVRAEPSTARVPEAP